MEQRNRWLMEWEYHIHALHDLQVTGNYGGAILNRDATTAEFNRLGSEGWELVAVMPGTEEFLAVFKRQKQGSGRPAA